MTHLLGVSYLNVQPAQRLREVRCIFFHAEDQFVRCKKAAAAASGGKKRSKYSKDYTEGWVEFYNKWVAKPVAASLHNTWYLQARPLPL